MEMMRHIARTTDHVLLSVLSANPDALAAGQLVALPLVDPAIGSTFAILRLQARTLPPVADALARAIAVADRAAARIGRELAVAGPAAVARRKGAARSRSGATAS
jgi:hypothetical protein